MRHNFFIHVSVGGHLGCFHVLNIINSAAVNIRVPVVSELFLSVILLQVSPCLYDLFMYSGFNIDNFPFSTCGF